MVSCHRCNQEGHISRECTEEQKCYNCQKSGHLSRDCPEPSEKSCYNCNEKGHIVIKNLGIVLNIC
ncbi:hypothetical protein K502DRAFT_256345 [Neoconidiobolus thromboides FSU 785]|nr:hypothetical protein K502DRAFT_256345 [Neoconidiobolus thromboides FSU 785]